MPYTSFPPIISFSLPFFPPLLCSRWSFPESFLTPSASCTRFRGNLGNRILGSPKQRMESHLKGHSCLKAAAALFSSGGKNGVKTPLNPSPRKNPTPTTPDTSKLSPPGPPQVTTRSPLPLLSPVSPPTLQHSRGDAHPGDGVQIKRKFQLPSCPWVSPLPRRRNSRGRGGSAIPGRHRQKG